MLGNRFIVVELSEVDLVEDDPQYRDHYQEASGTAISDGGAAAKAEAEAAAAHAARKKAHEKLIVSRATLASAAGVA